MLARKKRSETALFNYAALISSLGVVTKRVGFSTKEIASVSLVRLTLW
ncbi:hypothetical protein JCM19238_4759 [Vibrio ponticus]|nr:hypothetical protein JCM19238_4759 [Vibrio ponticus]